MRRRSLALLMYLLLVPAAGQAQPTNLDVYQTLAVRCLAAVPESAQTLRLDAPEAMPYLRTALVAHWQAEGRTLYLADSLAASPVPHLRYTVEQAQVTYARAGRREWQRTVALAVRYTYLAPDGRILADDRCQESATDTIPRARRAALEAAAYPETQGDVPRGSWRRRYLEPVLLAAATVVTAYLFFNLRSDRSDDDL